MNTQVLVIGAGIIGATTALSLAEQGFRVTIIEQEPALGCGASGNNGAQLSYNYTDSMATPELLWKLPKLAMAFDPAFRVKMRLDWNFIKWGLQFLASCSQKKSDANTLAVLALALQSKEMMHNWVGRYRFDFKHNVAKKLHLYESSSEFEVAKRRVDLKNRHGGNQACLDTSQTMAIEPTLAAMNAKLVGAVYSPDDEVGDVRDFTRQAIDKSIQLTGGELLFNTPCEGINIENGRCKSIVTSQGVIECDQVVICAGENSQLVAAKLGLDCTPIIPVTGFSLDYPANQHTPEISLTDTARKMVLCKLGSRLRVAGIADVGHSPRSLRAKRTDILRESLMSRFPVAGDYESKPMLWAGARPMTPNSVPIIERSKIPNVYINSGHGMLGWTLAAGSASRLSELIVK